MWDGHSWLGWIVIGLLAGGLAKLLMPGKDPGGCLITVLLGIAGAFLAAYLGQLAGWYAPGQKASFLAAVGGSFLILLAYRILLKRD